MDVLMNKDVLLILGLDRKQHESNSKTSKPKQTP